MFSQPFEKPVYVLVGLGFPRQINNTDLSPKSPPVLRRVLGLMFGPKRPAFPVPDCWRIPWA